MNNQNLHTESIYSNKNLIANLSLIPGFNELINKDDVDNSNILKLNKIVCKTANNQAFKLVKYDKNVLNYDLIKTYGLIRSIVLNSDNNVVAFSPPKSIPSDEFIRNYPNDYMNCGDKLNYCDIIAEEFVEGTMINVFWDPTIGLTGSWEISTRNTIGAESSFYKSSDTKTFRDMFFEAAKYNNLLFDYLNPLYSYSFVLQHPENRIVVPFNQPKLYLVAIYEIDNSDKNNIKVYSINLESVKPLYLYGANISFPKRYNYGFENYSDLIDKYASMNTPYHVVGVVFRNVKTGERTKIRNPVYEQVRKLRGNQPKLQYQYLCLRKEGKVRDFLNFYSENKKEFSAFRDQVHLFTQTLYTNYISCYIKKEKPLIQFSEQYRTHMFTIHKKYMDELREKKQFVTNTVVINYVNQLHPSLLMYCLNFQMRKRNIDTEISDMEINDSNI
jgi:hypothetical protein